MKYGALDSLPRETNINGQFHQLSYIRPDEAELLKSMGGAGTAGPGGIPQYGFKSWANENLGTNFDTSSSSSISSNNNSDDDKPNFFTAIKDTFTEVFTLGTADTTTYNSTEPSNTFVTDVGQAAADTVVEIITLGTADTETYNPTTTATDTTATDTTATATTTDPALEIRTLASGQKYSVDANGNFVALVGGAPQVFYDAFGNEYATRAEAINADEVAELSSTLANTDVMGPYDGGGYFDAMGNEYNSQAAAAAADIEASALSKAASGSQEVSDYIDKFGMTGLEDRFLVGRINPATGKPYEARDTNIVNPLDADTIPYAGSDNTYTNEEIQYFSGDPYSSTVGGVSLNDPFDDPRTEVIETEEDYPGSVDYVPPVEEIIGVPMGPESGSGPSYRDVYASQDVYGDFYGGRSGGLWDRFSKSYLTRFGYSPEQFNEMIRKVENPDGTTSFFGADGAMINPESIGSNYRLAGDPTSLKIGEEQVKVGTQTIDSSGNLIDTGYIDGYNASNYNVS